MKCLDVPQYFFNGKTRPDTISNREITKKCALNGDRTQAFKHSQTHSSYDKKNLKTTNRTLEINRKYTDYTNLKSMISTKYNNYLNK